VPCRACWAGAFVSSIDGVRRLEARANGPVADVAAAEAMGRSVAADLLQQGADVILAELAASPGAP
jgi:porphobilinogen deaminase